MSEVFDPREAAAREMERRGKIEAYLRESLAGEERIATPMDPRCEVSVVIPAYAEREGIFRPLLSLARQKGIRPEQFEVIIVVNNPPTEPTRQAGESEADWRRKRDLYLMSSHQNQQTLGILRALSDGRIPDGVTDAEREQVEEVLGSGIRVFCVDKASDGATLPPEAANVGGARNRGVAEAVERFQKIGRNGIIAQSDADVRFSSDYVSSLIRAFQNGPELVGLSGKIDFEMTNEMKALFKSMASGASMLSEYQWLADRLKAGERVPAAGQIKTEQTVHFSGANMASRAFEAAIVGGVPKLAGGEDPAFGFRLSDIGRVTRDEAVVTHPWDRFSARTAADAGHGQHRLRLRDQLENEERLVEHPDSIFAKRRFTREVRRLAQDPDTSFEAFRQAMTVDGVQLLDDDGIADVVRAIRTGDDALTGKPLFQGLRFAIDEKLKEIHPDIPFDRAAEELLAKMLVDEAVRGRYQANLSKEYERQLAYVRDRETFLRAYVDLMGDSDIDPLDTDAVLDLLRANADRLGKSGAESIVGDPEVVRGPLQQIGAAYKAGPAYDSLRSAMVLAYPELLKDPKDDPVRWTTMRLSALSRAID